MLNELTIAHPLKVNFFQSDCLAQQAQKSIIKITNLIANLLFEHKIPQD